MTRLCCGSEKYIRVVECTFKAERMCGREENQKLRASLRCIVFLFLSSFTNDTQHRAGRVCFLVFLAEQMVPPCQS